MINYSWIDAEGNTLTEKAEPHKITKIENNYFWNNEPLNYNDKKQIASLTAFQTLQLSEEFSVKAAQASLKLSIGIGVAATAISTLIHIDYIGDMWRAFEAGAIGTIKAAMVTSIASAIGGYATGAFLDKMGQNKKFKLAKSLIIPIDWVKEGLSHIKKTIKSLNLYDNFKSYLHKLLFSLSESGKDFLIISKNKIKTTSSSSIKNIMSKDFYVKLSGRSLVDNVYAIFYKDKKVNSIDTLIY